MFGAILTMRDDCLSCSREIAKQVRAADKARAVESRKIRQET
jgi:hypothetical protein